MESLIGCFSQREEEDFISDVRDQVNVNSMCFYLSQYETKDLQKRKQLHGSLRGRRWRESLKRHRITLITFGPQK